MIHDDFKKWLKPHYLIAAFALLQFVIAVFTHSLSFTQEEAMWQYIGRNWISNNMPPYSGGVDNKSPLIFYIFGISDWLFGNNTWFPRLLGTIVQSVGVWYLYKIVLRLAGYNAAIFSITIYGFSLMWVITGGRYTSFTETYAVAFMIMAFYYALCFEKSSYFILCGTMAAAAICFRLTGIFGCLALCILLVRKNYKMFLPFLIGSVSVMTLFFIWLYFENISIKDFIFHGITDNFGEGSVTKTPFSLQLNNFIEAFILSPLLLFYPFVFYFILKIKKPSILILWLTLEFIGIMLLGIIARNHLKHILPALSAISGISIAVLFTRYSLQFKWVYALIVLAFFPKTLEPLYGIKNTFFPQKDKSDLFCSTPLLQPDPYQLKQFGLWIKDSLQPRGKVFVAGMGAQVQAYSETLSPTLYFNVTQTRTAKERLYSDFSKTKPQYIFIPTFKEYENISSDLKFFIDNLVKREYLYVNCKYGYGIYNRK